MMKSKKSKIATMAAAMAISMAPVPASSLTYNEASFKSAGISTTTQRELQDGIAFISINDAIPYLDDVTNRLLWHTGSIREEWELKQIPIDMSKQKPFTRKHLTKIIREHINMCEAFVEAVRIALNSVPPEDVELRKDIVRFGRAAAGLRFAAEDFMSFIEQTHPAQKTSSEQLNVTGDQVRAAIRAEHKSLGLDAPCFSRG